MEMANNSNNDPIGNALNLPSFQGPSKAVANIINEASRDSALEDFKTARANILKQIEEINDKITELSQIATNSQGARDYEVLGKLIQTSAQMSSQLLDLQKRIREIEEAEENTSENSQIINNNLIVTTAELQKLIKEMDNGKKGAIIDAEYKEV